MNDEIKEILEDLKDSGEGKYINPFELTDDSCKSLLDYITNLQQENERLKKKLTTKKLFKKHKVQTPENFEIRKIFELQQRIEKAVEYIKQHRKVYKLGVNQEIDEFDYISTSPRVLLNILRGKCDDK